MTSDDLSDPVALLWERFRPLVRERLELIRAFAEGDGSAGREEAARAAHNLAGSLGSYGRREGSVIARRLDQHLGGEGPVTPGDVLAELQALRAVVDV